MLYLIKTVYYIEETGEVLKLLKIGYTRDNESTMHSRFTAYKLHNPGHTVLYRIPNLTEYDEKVVLGKFSDLMYEDYGREWFKWDQGIIDFFEELSKDPKEALKGLTYVSKNPGMVRISGKSYKETEEIRKLFRVYLNIFLSGREKEEFFDVGETLCDIFSQGISTLEGLYDYLNSIYYDEFLVFKEKVDILESDKELKDFVFNYYNGTIRDKYELLCDTESSFIERVLDFILPGKIKTSYVILGPEKLKSLGYNKTLIDRQLGKIVFNKDSLKYEMLYTFNVGDILLIPHIKDVLSSIYKKVGCTKSPKAIDLEEFFSIKTSVVWRDLDGSGVKKRVNTYKILSVKPEFENDYNLIKEIVNQEGN